MDKQIVLRSLDMYVIGAYVLILTGLGIWASLRKRGQENLFLAGHSLRWYNIGLSIFSININPGTIISSASIAYATGVVTANTEWLGGPVFIAMLVMVFIPHYRNTQISTMPEFLSRRFNNSCRTFLTWYSIFTTLVVWIGQSVYVGGILLSQILHWPLWASVIALMAIAAFFTIAGGLTTIAMTNTFQGLVILGASAALVIIGFMKIGSLSDFIHSVPADHWSLFRPADDAVYPWHAMLLGLPVVSIWFWCTDQTVVQCFLGAKTLRESQLGGVFSSGLKLLVPFLFFAPGILCRSLHPDLNQSDDAYMLMVANFLPVGLAGLIVAVLMTGIVGTIDAGLNSLSTVFTLDFYCKNYRPGASTREVIWIGRVVGFGAAVIGVLFALGFGAIERMDLWTLSASLISFMAPPITAVFLMGVLWKRTTPFAAFSGLVIGSIVSILIGVCYMAKWPGGVVWPHFWLLSFYLCAGIMAYMAIASLGASPADRPALATIRESYASEHHSTKTIWRFWLLLAVIILALELFVWWLGRQ